jgi:hypothetical protein
MAECRTPEPPRTYPLSLPKELARPEYKEIPLESIQAVDPSLTDTDMEHIHECIDMMGSE